MEDQMQLDFDSRKPKRMYRLNDPVTSQIAAKKASKKLSENKKIIIQALSAIYPEGYTDEELAGATGLQEDNARKRRGDLVSDGFVEYMGITRLTKRQSPARVWRLKK